MAERTFFIRFKSPELSAPPVTADRAEIYGEHLVFWRSTGQLAGLYLLEEVEGWSDSAACHETGEPGSGFHAGPDVT